MGLIALPMSSWFFRSRFVVASLSGRSPVALTTKRRVHHTWSSHSLRIASWKAAPFDISAVGGWLGSACAGPAGAAGAPSAAAFASSRRRATAGSDRSAASYAPGCSRYFGGHFGQQKWTMAPFTSAVTPRAIGEPVTGHFVFWRSIALRGASSARTDPAANTAATTSERTDAEIVARDMAGSPDLGPSLDAARHRRSHQSVVAPTLTTRVGESEGCEKPRGRPGAPLARLGSNRLLWKGIG